MRGAAKAKIIFFFFFLYLFAGAGRTEREGKSVVFLISVNLHLVMSVSMMCPHTSYQTTGHSSKGLVVKSGSNLQENNRVCFKFNEHVYTKSGSRNKFSKGKFFKTYIPSAAILIKTLIFVGTYGYRLHSRKVLKNFNCNY